MQFRDHYSWWKCSFVNHSQHKGSFTECQNLPWVGIFERLMLIDNKTNIYILVRLNLKHMFFNQNQKYIQTIAMSIVIGYSLRSGWSSKFWVESIMATLKCYSFRQVIVCAVWSIEGAATCSLRSWSIAWPCRRGGRYSSILFRLVGKTG